MAESNGGVKVLINDIGSKLVLRITYFECLCVSVSSANQIAHFAAEVAK